MVKNKVIRIIFVPLREFPRMYLISFLKIVKNFLIAMWYEDLLFHAVTGRKTIVDNMISHPDENMYELGSNIEKRFVIIFRISIKMLHFFF